MIRLLLVLCVLSLLSLAHCSTYKGYLSVTIVRGRNLKGDKWGETDGYVKMWFGRLSRTTRTIKNDDNPHWNKCYDLGLVDTRSLLLIQVWDKDWWTHDDRLFSCAKSVFQGTHLFYCSSSKGTVEVRYTLTCPSYLTGYRCNYRIPQPQSKHPA